MHHIQTVTSRVDYTAKVLCVRLNQGVLYLTGENTKVVLVEFSTLSLAVLINSSTSALHTNSHF